jgi:hypothetical protein
MTKSSVKVDPLVIDSLRTLVLNVRREYGLKTTQEDVVSALVYGTSVPQAVGMLIAFQRHAAALVTGDAAADVDA